jgi:hypothetical protein
MQSTQMTQILAEMGALRSMARELGVTEKQVRNGAEALVPAILCGFGKQAQSRLQRLDSLGELVAHLGGGDLLDNVLAPRQSDVSRGHELLRHIFGSKDGSRAVAQNGAAQSGVEVYLLKQMLPMLAMLVAGYLARQPGFVAPRESSAAAATSDGMTQRNPPDDILCTAARSMQPPRPMRR